MEDLSSDVLRSAEPQGQIPLLFNGFRSSCFEMRPEVEAIMKFVMGLSPRSYFAMVLCLGILLPSALFASQARVAAVGGLDLVMDDETADLSPFLFGNPAGLALLPPQSRFDMAGIFSLDTPAYDASAQSEAYGTFSRVGSDFPSSSLLSYTAPAFTYQGLILFPAKEWAVQLSGDLIHASQQPNGNALDNTTDRLRGTGRVAADLGPLVLGTGIDTTQVQRDFPNPFGPGSNGQGNSTLLISNSGLLLDLPLDHAKEPAHLRIGGLFGTQISNSQEKDDFTANPGGTPVDLTVTLSVPSYTNFGPDLFLEVPGAFQAGLVGRVSHTELDYQLDSSNTLLISSIPNYLLQTDDTLVVLGSAKGKFPLPGTLRQKMTLNMGGYFLIGNAQSKQTDPTGAPVQTTNESDLQLGLGAGVENAGDFTLGLQTLLETRSGSYAPTSGSGYSLDYLAYSISMGGEKWVNERWALRGGLSFEDDYNGGGANVVKVHYQVPPGTRIVATILFAGVGFKQGSFRSDLTLWMGQPSVYDSPNPDDFYTQAGAQGTLTFLF